MKEATLVEFIAYANKHYDGHFTLLKFTTNWRAAFGTIEWRPDVVEWSEAIARMPFGETMSLAMGAALFAEQKRGTSEYDV